MQHFGKGAVRVVKNYTKGYSDTQAKVRDATSNDPWGPSGTQMNEIAQMTYNQGDFVEIMEMLDKRLNDKGKNWRHVFKSLTLLDYLLHQGSENVIIYFKDNLYVIKTLKEFQYVDEDGKDQGGNVRAKAKDITSLLQDEGRLRTERRARASMRERMVKGAGEDGEFDEATRGADENSRRRGAGVGGGTDDEMRRAIEESKRSLQQEQMTAEEKDLAQAIKLSEEEEARRRRGVEESNANALFDEQNQLPPPVNNNPFPFLDAPPQQQQLQLQPQFTSIQPQFTSFNPYQQQAEMEAEYMRQQQQQAFLQQQQQEEWMRQQQMLQQQQLQQQQQEEWMRQQQMAQQQQLVPQPTGFGANNPFAQTQQQQPPPPLPSFSSPTQQHPPAFNLPGTYDNGSSPQPSFQPNPSPSPAQDQNPNGGPRFKVKVNDGENQRLASLLANRDDGQDTFGNVGALRYGHTNAGRAIIAQQTGHNPFARQQQQQQQNEQPFFSI
ncbi:epsin domain-containing protein [Mycena maculata]|uniref:Epsin domain-containing protein n=1 Tax=Mycena maculata TaxID=230809 RepID=A0AAD7N7I2_9AGAR|nr:epsin domain-containing protein [Mycena maculata]